MARLDAVNKRLDFNVSETLTQSLARIRQAEAGQKDQGQVQVDFAVELSSLARWELQGLQWASTFKGESCHA